MQRFVRMVQDHSCHGYFGRNFNPLEATPMPIIVAAEIIPILIKYRVSYSDMERVMDVVKREVRGYPIRLPDSIKTPDCDDRSRIKQYGEFAEAHCND